MSDGDDTLFAGNVVRILQSPPARMVNFKLKNYTISTMGLLTVAALINSGRLKCKVDHKKVDPKAAAEFNATEKAIYGKETGIFYKDQKNTIIHESTHAYLYMLGAVQKDLAIRNIDNETAGYLAGAIYQVAIDLFDPPPATGVKLTVDNPNAIEIAMALVKPKLPSKLNPDATNAGAPITFTDDELKTLVAKIKSMPLYKGWNTVNKMRGL